jgi:hypothetical protein
MCEDGTCVSEAEFTDCHVHVCMYMYEPAYESFYIWNSQDMGHLQHEYSGIPKHLRHPGTFFEIDFPLLLPLVFLEPACEPGTELSEELVRSISRVPCVD